MRILADAHEPRRLCKTAFCPGSGLGLYEFNHMPFGLTGAPSSFQRSMDKVLCGLLFTTTYVDDILIHSENEDAHKQHLQEVFQRLREAGLTLKGKKCHIGMSEVSYLGHVFSRKGMAPDPKKIQSCQLANTNKCLRSTPIHWPGIVLLQVHLQLCRHCSSLVCLDTEECTFHLDSRL